MFNTYACIRIITYIYRSTFLSRIYCCKYTGPLLATLLHTRRVYRAYIHRGLKKEKKQKIRNNDCLCVRDSHMYVLLNCLPTVSHIHWSFLKYAYILCDFEGGNNITILIWKSKFTEIKKMFITFFSCNMMAKNAT